jgi:chemotaxis protein methyltransferase CheR
VEEIDRSTERIAKITGAYAVPAEAREVDPSALLSELFDLLEAERHDEGLSRISALSARLSTPASLLSELELCRAAIYGEKGRSRDAERILAALLARGACETGAHYLLGLLRENERDLDRAGYHYRESMQRDTRFSLPYLRLGMLLRRAGDDRAALGLLEKARELLATEVRARIVIFGGGFRREVLLELCKAQLDALRAGF